MKINYPFEPFSSSPRSAKCGNGYPKFPFSSPPEFQDRVFKKAFSHSFPYPYLTRTQGELISTPRTIVDLENDFFSVALSPGEGGRVISIFDKKNQHELLWQSPNTLYANIGLNGRWTIGGLEWNASRLGHCVHSIFNLGYEVIAFHDGRTGVRFGATDELLQTSWHVTLTLGETQVLARIHYQNHSKQRQPKYWWTNIAVPIKENSRLLYQPGPLLTHTMSYPACFFKENWPLYRNRDASNWLNQVENLSTYFHQNRSEFMGYSDQEESWSFFHRADTRICKGRKLWSMSASHPHHVWWSRIAEPGWTAYAEMQSGLSPMQVELDEMEPGEILEWTESFGAISTSFPDSNDTSFSAFEKAAHAQTDTEWKAAQEASFWKEQNKSVGYAPELRVQLSQKITTHDPIEIAELDQIIQNEWVGGENWVSYLKGIKTRSPRQTLVYAAALLDLGRTLEAEAALNEITISGDSLTLGMTSYLKGRLALEQNESEKAIGHYLRAIELAPEQIAPYRELSALYKDSQRTSERELLLRKASPTIQQYDHYRINLAEILFLRGNFSEARQLLQAPLYQIAEADLHTWRLFKESFIAEAFQAESSHDLPKALILLTAAAQEYPQFTIGRDEVWLNTDLLYYRWKISVAAGNARVAHGFLQQGLGQKHRPHSTEAAYQYRLATESQHPSASQRRQEIDIYDSTHEMKSISAMVPLRSAILEVLNDKKWDQWTTLQQDPLYRYRALWEISKKQL